MPSPVNATTDSHGYHYVETALWWKDACSVLPSFAEVWWPDYATKVIEDTIDDFPVVIQLWKGWCQKFLGRDDFPGGIGGEVGIYHRVGGKLPPHSLPHFPAKISDFVLGGLTRVGAEHLWWPYPELLTTLTFDLVNPLTNDVFFSAGPETTYWLNKWMDPSSYERYRVAKGGQLPTFSSQYKMRFTINGKSYEW